MSKRTRLATVLVIAGAIGLGGLLAMSPALAGAGLIPGPSASAPAGGYGMHGGLGRMGPGMGRGPGQMAGQGGDQGVRMWDGTCPGLAGDAAKGTLTGQQKTTLVAMAQEEKLAQDLYAAFAGKYDAVIFDRIGAAETRHLSTVRTLLDRYGVPDPTAGKPAGQFGDNAVSSQYDQLLARGAASEKAALRAAAAVEQADIDALQKALDGLRAPDVRQVYTHLLNASRQHLSAFQAWANR